MEQDNYFYETPRLPMFMLMEDTNVVRVRVFRYKNGKLDGVLADWGVGNYQNEFYTAENWFSEYELPFYCLYKDEFGEIIHPIERRPLRVWAKVESEQCGYTAKKLYEEFIESAKRVHCPFFDSEEEASNYIFRII